MSGGLKEIRRLGGCVFWLGWGGVCGCGRRGMDDVVGGEGLYLLGVVLGDIVRLGYCGCVMG